MADEEELDLEDLQKLVAGLKVDASLNGSEAATATPSVLESKDVAGIVKYIKEHNCKKIIVASGAGISTSAGIPDFRTPGTGLYSNLQRFNLSTPEEVFDISYFKTNPKPFTILAKEMYPTGKHKPTIGHYFVRMLADKGLLLRNFTQNVDTLERLAGIPADYLVEAHGCFAEAHCISCHKEYDQQYVKDKLFADEIVRCSSCKGLVKPDIVFFGEGLPERFFTLMKNDFEQCDLLIIIGTSLKVQPFASIVNRTKPGVPRILINLEKVGEADPVMRYFGLPAGLDFSKPSSSDVFFQTTCDDGCREFARLMGWEEELMELKNKANEALEKQWLEQKTKVEKETKTN